MVGNIKEKKLNVIKFKYHHGTDNDKWALNR